MKNNLKRIDAHFVVAGKYHDIDFARLEILKLLSEHSEIRTTIACDYSNTERLQECKFLVSYCCDLIPGREELATIKTWLESGGKWLALHGTNSFLKFVSGTVDTPNERPDVMDVLGTQFKAHPPIGPFTVEVVNPNHELTKGMSDFEIVDELYLSETMAEVNVLLETQYKGTAAGFTKEHWGLTKVPILYTRKIGKGMVTYNTLGHCRGHYDLPGMQDFYPNPEKCA